MLQKFYFLETQINKNLENLVKKKVIRQIFTNRTTGKQRKYFYILCQTVMAPEAYAPFDPLLLNPVLIFMDIFIYIGSYSNLTLLCQKFGILFQIVSSLFVLPTVIILTIKVLIIIKGTKYLTELSLSDTRATY